MLTIKDLLNKIFPSQDVSTCVEVCQDGITYSIPIYYDTDLYGSLGSGLSPNFAFIGKDSFIPEVCWRVKEGVHVPSSEIQILIEYYKRVEPALYAYGKIILERLVKKGHTIEKEHFIFWLLFHEFGHYIDFKRNFDCDIIAYNIHYKDDLKKLKDLRVLGLNTLDNQVKYNEGLRREKYANVKAVELLTQYIFNIQ